MGIVNLMHILCSNLREGLIIFLFFSGESCSGFISDGFPVSFYGVNPAVCETEA